MSRLYWLIDQLENNTKLDDITRGNYHVEVEQIEAGED